MVKKILSLAVLASLVSVESADAQQSRVYDRNNNYVIDVRGNCATSNIEGEVCEISAPDHSHAVVDNNPRKLNYEDTVVYFDFDKSRLKGNEVAKLDRLVEFVRTANVTSVDVVGYADRVGSDSYNDALSRRRADAVIKYLTNNGMNGIKVADIQALGETASKDRCLDVVGRQAVIDCLWENRKVEVRVNYKN